MIPIRHRYSKRTDGKPPLGRIWMPSLLQLGKKSWRGGWQFIFPAQCATLFGLERSTGLRLLKLVIGAPAAPDTTLRHVSWLSNSTNTACLSHRLSSVSPPSVILCCSYSFTLPPLFFSMHLSQTLPMRSKDITDVLLQPGWIRRETRMQRGRSAPLLRATGVITITNAYRALFQTPELMAVTWEASKGSGNKDWTPHRHHHACDKCELAAQMKIIGPDFLKFLLSLTVVSSWFISHFWLKTLLFYIPGNL